MSFKNGKEVIDFAKKNNVVMVDCRITDSPGSVAALLVTRSRKLDESTFEDGYGLRRLVDPRLEGDQRERHAHDPGSEHRVHRPVPRAPDAGADLRRRSIRSRVSPTAAIRATSRSEAELYVKQTGIADTVYFGPEAEFFVFNRRALRRRREQRLLRARLEREQSGTRGVTRTARTSATRSATRKATSRFRRTTPNRISAPRCVLEMEKIGIVIETQHHEVATAGQARSTCSSTRSVVMADKLLKYKYVVKNVAKKNGMTATFMPKPLFKDNGSGMHSHQSLWKDGKPLFAGDKYAGLSETRPLLHRRHPQALARARGLHEPDHELVQATRAGLRGAGEPGVLDRATVPRPAASRPTRRARRPSGSRCDTRIRPATRTWPSRRC